MLAGVLFSSDLVFDVIGFVEMGGDDTFFLVKALETKCGAATSTESVILVF